MSFGFGSILPPDELLLLPPIEPLLELLLLDELLELLDVELVDELLELLDVELVDELLLDDFPSVLISSDEPPPQALSNKITLARRVERSTVLVSFYLVLIS